MLSQELLKNNLKEAFSTIKANPGPLTAPLMSPIVSSQLANAYHRYAITATAGPLVQVVSGNPAVLASQLSALPMMGGWQTGLVLYWTPVMFTGPGFIPLNPIVPASLSTAGAAISALLAESFSTSMSEDVFCLRLSGVLHTVTSGLIVTSTTISTPPVIAPVPVV